MSNPYMNYPNVNQGYQQNKFYNQPQYQNIYPPQPPPLPPKNTQNPPSTPNIIVISNANAAAASAGGGLVQGGINFCPVCLMNTGSYVTRGYGKQAAEWCLILFFLTCFLCWIPYVLEACKQQQIRCVNCQAIKRSF